jgi:hypothetical protein
VAWIHTGCGELALSLTEELAHDCLRLGIGGAWGSGEPKRVAVLTQRSAHRPPLPQLRKPPVTATWTPTAARRRPVLFPAALLEDDPVELSRSRAAVFLPTPETLILVRREAGELEATGHPSRPSGPTVVSRRQRIGGRMS